jgi:hypothetical protein
VHPNDGFLKSLADTKIRIITVLLSNRLAIVPVINPELRAIVAGLGLARDDSVCKIKHC